MKKPNNRLNKNLIKKLSKKPLGLLILALVLAFEAYKSLNPSAAPSLPLKDTKQKRVRLMTYNLENLFDTLNDPKKDDETFLPLSKKNNKVKQKCKQAHKKHWVKDCLETNWTSFKLDEKMKRLSKVVKAAKPDLLIVQEVENLKVLKDWNKKYLGFPTVILKEGPDRRGIDVGILSSLETLGATKLHLQRSAKSRVKATRGILEASFRLPNNEKITVFGLHFPSQGSPTRARSEAINTLNRLVKKTSGLVVAGGDFNIVKKESFLYRKKLSKHWEVSHLIGCKKCKGTNYYRRSRSWSFLDALLFSKNFKNSKTWTLDLKSIQVFNSHKVQNNRFKTPARFEMGKHPTGVSDHWPMVADLLLKVSGKNNDKTKP